MSSKLHQQIICLVTLAGLVLSSCTQDLQDDIDYSVLPSAPPIYPAGRQADMQVLIQPHYVGQWHNGHTYMTISMRGDLVHIAVKSEQLTFAPESIRRDVWIFWLDVSRALLVEWRSRSKELIVLPHIGNVLADATGRWKIYHASGLSGNASNQLHCIR